MTPRTCRAACVGVLVLSLTAPAPAVLAQEVPRPQLTEAQKQKTKEHYEKATRLYNVGKYPEAIIEYEAAYLVSADAGMLYNIAQCHRNNGQPEEAARFYRNYLRNDPNSSRKQDVERFIAEMDRLAEEKRRQAPTPAPIGGPTPGPVTAPPPVGGPVPGPLPSPTPPPAAVTTTGPEVPGPSAPEPEPERRSRFWPLTFMIGGGVLLGTSLALGAVAGQKAKEMEDLAKRNGTFDSNAKKIEDQGKAASAVALLSGLVGLAAGGTGMYLWLRSPGSNERAVAVYPLAAQGLVGGGARITF